MTRVFQQLLNILIELSNYCLKVGIPYPDLLALNIR